MPSPTVENYLKALHMLANDRDETSSSKLSKMLGVSVPTVNNMVKKLHQQGLVFYKKYQPIQLTSLGKKKAAEIIRKHRLTEMYLVEKMGFGWEEVHEIAEQMEHIKSQAFFDRMDALLGNPTTDPHGSPIPDRHGAISEKHYRTLSDCDVGEIVIIKALAHSSGEFLRFLNEKSISIGLSVEILKKEMFDSSMLVSYDNRRETLSQMASDNLLVEKVI